MKNTRWVGFTIANGKNLAAYLLTSLQMSLKDCSLLLPLPRNFLSSHPPPLLFHTSHDKCNGGFLNSIFLRSHFSHIIYWDLLLLLSLGGHLELKPFCIFG